MKTNLILLAILLCFSNYSYAQYKEFSTFFTLEDATGKKDTIWYEANKNAHDYELDADLGEVEVKEPIDSNRFFIIKHWDSFTNPLYLSNKIANKATTFQAIGFNIIFINAEFPVKITMDRTFIDPSNEFDHRYTNYFMTYCQWPFLWEIWYEVPGFECLLTEPIYIEDPRIKKAEYSCDNHYVYEIDVKDKGIQTFYGIEIATIILDDHCYSQLETDQNIMEEKVLIAPNPAGDHLRVRLNAGSDIKYFITDISGRLISRGISEYESTIAVSALTSGVYIISMTDSNHKTYRQKFVKM